jgi:hypothetical protein
MNRKITEEKFNEIKKFLNTPILAKPAITYVAEEFGYSSGTIALINRFNTFEEYKKYRTERLKQYGRDFLENEMRFIKQEQEKTKIDMRR